jgi:hypothetical protein
VWLAGTSLVAARALLGRWLLAVFRRRHAPPGDGALNDRVRALAGRLGLRRRVRVLEVPGLCGPAAFGILRPTVAVPAGFARDFDAPSQEVMLAHELAHLAGRDPAWHLLADLVAAALWWQPLAWWSRHRLRAAGEAAADEASLLVADGPAVLAACLVALGARLACPGRPGWVRMAGGGFRSGLGRRVERLLRLGGQTWRPPGQARARWALTLGAAALLGGAVLSTAWARPQAFHQGDVPMKTMQRAWRRSLAGALLFAALAPTADAPRAEDPPPKPTPKVGETPPGTGGEAAPGGSPREAPQAEAKLRVILKDLEAQIQKLQAETARTAETRLKVLREKIEKLEAEKAKAQAELKALTAKRIRVFRLKHATPEEVAQALDNFLQGPADAPAFAVDFGFAPGGQRPPGTPARGGMPGPPGPGMPGGFVGGVAGPAPGWHVTVDDRTRSLIVRGSRRDLRVAADLVAVLDTPPGKPLPKVSSLRAFKLRFARAPKLAEILEALELKARAVAMPKTNTLIVAGSDEVLKEVGDLVQELDVEGKGKEEPGEGR